MNEIDNFLTFLFSNIENEDITLTKKMKYGYRHYYLNVRIENEEELNNHQTNSFINSYNDLSIQIDNRNKCIELYSGTLETVVIENEELVLKWTNIFEEYVANNLERDVNLIINSIFINTKQKNLLRGYKLKKIDI